MNDPGPIGDLRLRQELAEHMKIVRSYTHAIVSEKKGIGIRIGTAVAFRLGERMFLITAGHNLEWKFEVRLFAGEGPAVHAEVLNHHFHPDSLRTDVHRDIGFVEVKNVPSLTACDLEQFHIGERRPKREEYVAPLFIAGFPKSGFLPPDQPNQIGMAVIGGYVLGVSETTLEIEYERSGHAVSPDGSTFEESSFFATPKGFSGGGVWMLLKPKEGELFLPHKHVKMCGTDFQWDESKRILQAMRPRISLPYFFEKYPELRAQYGQVLGP